MEENNPFIDASAAIAAEASNCVAFLIAAI